MQNPSVRAQVVYGASSLASTSQQARSDAGLLLCHVLQQDRVWLLTHPDELLTEEQQQRYAALLDRRARHEPMQYILGRQEFYGLSLKVTPAVLIPRPETEQLVEAVLERLSKSCPVRIADVGTGSGALALALAHHLPLAHVDAFDLSTKALAVAEENARALDLHERISFIESDLLSAAGGTLYDCIVSNPPYVATTEQLEPQVALWEPHSALFAGSDGLAIYHRLLPQAASHLVLHGLFAIEQGAGQQVALAHMFGAAQEWTEPVFLKDLQGIARVSLVQRR